MTKGEAIRGDPAVHHVRAEETMGLVEAMAREVPERSGTRPRTDMIRGRRRVAVRDHGSLQGGREAKAVGQKNRWDQ
jgi:hypothetical protein